MLRAAALQDDEVRVEADEALFERARRFTTSGQTEEAKHTYIELLARSPGHFGALNNLGTLLHETGYRTAARTAYVEVVARHPNNPMGHVNLANVLREMGDAATARAHCEKALALSPDYSAAHRVLAGILTELGDAESAARHRHLGFERQTVITLPYRGTGKPVSLLVLVSALGGNIPIRHLLDDRIFHTSVIYADYWNAEEPLPPHDLVFNTIGDRDLCGAVLQSVASLLSRTAIPIVNLPAVVLRTGRAENAARLAQLPGVKTAKTMAFPRDMLCGPSARSAIEQAGFTFPLLFRSPGFHTGLHFVRVERPDALQTAASNLPGRELIVLEYLDARGADGKVRKYRAMFVNGDIHPLHLAVSADWKVHYFTAEMADSAEHRAEDDRFLSDMPGVIGPRAMNALGRIRDTLGLDYAGIDFGLNAQGDLLLFEANATMVVPSLDADKRWTYRRSAVARIHDAVRGMLVEKAGRNLASAPDLR